MYTVHQQQPPEPLPDDQTVYLLVTETGEPFHIQDPGIPHVFSAFVLTQKKNPDEFLQKVISFGEEFEEMMKGCHFIPLTVEELKQAPFDKPLDNFRLEFMINSDPELIKIMAEEHRGIEAKIYYIQPSDNFLPLFITTPGHKRPLIFTTREKVEKVLAKAIEKDFLGTADQIGSLPIKELLNWLKSKNIPQEVLVDLAPEDLDKPGFMCQYPTIN
jgi:hypothetical protein